jgi:hypothetical protein
VRRKHKEEPVHLFRLEGEERQNITGSAGEKKNGD